MNPKEFTPLFRNYPSPFNFRDVHTLITSGKRHRCVTLYLRHQTVRWCANWIWGISGRGTTRIAVVRHDWDGLSLCRWERGLRAVSNFYQLRAGDPPRSCDRSSSCNRKGEPVGGANPVMGLLIKLLGIYRRNYSKRYRQKIRRELQASGTLLPMDTVTGGTEDRSFSYRSA